MTSTEKELLKSILSISIDSKEKAEKVRELVEKASSDKAVSSELWCLLFQKVNEWNDDLWIKE